MSEALPTPPTSPTVSAAAEIPDPLQAIDDLLERYLYLLDEHQRLQREIGNCLSAGFFSITRANHSSPPGRRYGEDYYDERMKAITRVIVTHSKFVSSDEKLSEDTTLHCVPNYFEITHEKPGDQSSKGTTVTKDSALTLKDRAREGQGSEQKEQLRSSNKPISSNPLHWFGVLVPSALRDAQASFTSIVDDQIPAIANVIIEMRKVEQSVNDLRKTLSVDEEPNI
ncbi:uncharacterized protein CIMG_00444 [Coccidioides immitis RS]|uniref:Vacuolar ATPase assembly protein VMA22 n=1 Tax=Coccidioides immitis (strain RS) TaxID=246410 RepID=J3KH05_COCIM|nr:uncharacterized protein CIMG_00444 [Coccidioides immitis RS]EAS35090.3 hypothetical protein CIMG_00444 [Coccidioides immitis RS]